MRNIITNGCYINSVTLNNRGELSFTSNDTQINNLSISPTLLNIIKLDGNYVNSNISIDTDCILIADSTFITNTPITFAKDNLNIFLAGDFSNSIGINIDKDVKINTYENIPLSNIELNIQENSKTYLLGDFSNSSVTLENNSSLTVDGVLNSISTTSSANVVNLNLANGAIINNSTIDTEINLSGDEAAIDNFLGTNPNITDKVTITSTSYLTALSDGIGSIKLPISSIGKYKITASVIDETNEYILNSQSTFTVN